MDNCEQSIVERISHLQVLLQNDDYTKHTLSYDGLIDALLALYDECNNEILKKDNQLISDFVQKYQSFVVCVRNLRVSSTDFEVKGMIGKGHFGDVLLVKERVTGDVYAMKKLRKSDILSHRDGMLFENERDIMILSSLAEYSKWITQLQYSFQSFYNIYFIMEYLPGGNLATLLEENGGSLREDMIRFYTAEAVEAIESLHRMGYSHRDIKPDNMLLDKYGHLKLADFGSAAKIQKNGQITDKMPVGTADYIAPEVLNVLNGDGSYGPQCDWWSLGVVIFELCFGRTPFASNNTSSTYFNIMHFKNKLLISEDDVTLSHDIKRLIKGLLKGQNDRLIYLQIRQHRFYTGIDWDNLRNLKAPFIPILSSPDDTRYFPNITPQKATPRVEDFKLQKKFSGKNLPFVGFTYVRSEAEETHDLSSNTYVSCLSEIDGIKPAIVAEQFKLLDYKSNQCGKDGEEKCISWQERVRQLECEKNKYMSLYKAQKEMNDRFKEHMMMLKNEDSPVDESEEFFITGRRSIDTICQSIDVETVDIEIQREKNVDITIIGEKIPEVQTSISSFKLEIGQLKERVKELERERSQFDEELKCKENLSQKLMEVQMENEELKDQITKIETLKSKEMEENNLKEARAKILKLQRELTPLKESAKENRLKITKLEQELSSQKDSSKEARTLATKLTHDISVQKSQNKEEKQKSVKLQEELTKEREVIKELRAKISKLQTDLLIGRSGDVRKTPENSPRINNMTVTPRGIKGSGKPVKRKVFDEKENVTDEVKEERLNQRILNLEIEKEKAERKIAELEMELSKKGKVTPVKKIPTVGEKEMRELRNKTTELEKELLEGKDKLIEEKKKVEALEMNLESEKELLKKEQKRMATLEDKLKKESEEMKNMTNKLSTIEREMMDVKKEVEKLKSEKQEIKKELLKEKKENSKKKEDKEIVIISLKKQIQLNGEEMKEQKTLMTKLETELNEKIKIIKELKEKVNKLEKLMKEMEMKKSTEEPGKLESITKEINELKETNEERKRMIEKLELELSEKGEKIKETNEKYLGLELELNKEKENAKENQIELTKLKQQLKDGEKLVNNSRNLLKSKMEEIMKRKEELTAINGKVNELNLKIYSLSDQLEVNKNLLKKNEEIIKQKNEQLSKREENAVVQALKIKELESLIEQHESHEVKTVENVELKKANEKIKKLKKIIEENHVKIEVLTKQLESSEKLLTDGQNSLSDHIRNINSQGVQVNVEYQKLQDVLKTITDKQDKDGGKTSKAVEREKEKKHKEGDRIKEEDGSDQSKDQMKLIVEIKKENEMLKKECNEIKKELLVNKKYEVKSTNVAALELQVNRLETLLEKSRENAILQKQEAEKATRELALRNKELSDLKIDIRIVQREGKEIEKELKKCQMEKTELEEKLGKELEELKANNMTLSSDLKKCTKDKLEAEIKIEKYEEELMILNDKYDATVKEVQKLKTKCAEQEKGITDLKELLVNMNAESDGLTRLIDQLQLKLTEKEKSEVMLKEEGTKLKEDLQTIRKALNEEKSLKSFAEAGKRNLAADVEKQSKEIESLCQDLAEKEELIDDLYLKIEEMERCTSMMNDELEKIMKLTKVKDEEIVMLKEECSGYITKFHNAKMECEKLASELEEANNDSNALQSAVAELQSTIIQLESQNNEQNIKSNATLQQHAKLIEFLQGKMIDANKNKMGIKDRLFKSKSKEYQDAKDIEHKLKLERNKGMALAEQLYETQLKLNDAIAKLSQDQSSGKKSMGRTILANIVNSPTAMLEKQIVGRVKHNIPHKFELKLCKSPGHKCPSCDGAITIGRKISHCTECNLYAHVRCATKLPATCKLPSTCADLYVNINKHLPDLDKTYEVKNDMEGWCKILTDNKVWKRSFIKVEDAKLVLYDDENDGHDYFTLYKDTKLEESLDRNNIMQLSNVASTDMPFIIMLENSDKRLFIMSGSNEDKMNWINTIKHVIEEKADFTYPTSLGHNKGQVLYSFSELDEIKINCVVQLSSQVCIFGGEDGIYSMKIPVSNGSANSLIKLSNITHVTFMKLLPKIRMLLVISGESRIILKTDLRLLLLNAEAAACSGPHIEFEEVIVPDMANCKLLSVSSCNDFIAIVTDSAMFLLRWDGSEFSKILFTKKMKQNVVSLMITSECVIYATETEFRKINFSNFVDNIIPADMSSYEVTKCILKISKEKYLLCTNLFGTFVDKFGNKLSACDELKWTQTPIRIVYNKGFLTVTHENCISLIHYEENSRGKVLTIDYGNPVILGVSKHLKAGVFIKETENENVRIVLLDPISFIKENPKYSWSSISTRSLTTTEDRITDELNISSEISITSSILNTSEESEKENTAAQRKVHFDKEVTVYGKMTKRLDGMSTNL